MATTDNRRRPLGYKAIGGAIGASIPAATGAGYLIIPCAFLGSLLGYIVFMLLRMADEDLIRAAHHGRLVEVRALLKEGRDVNAKNQNGDTPLIVACVHSHLDVIEALLDAGADVNAKSDNGSTALIRASSRENPDVVEALLNKGADVNAKSNRGETSLSVAKHADIKALLTQAGANR